MRIGTKFLFDTEKDRISDAQKKLFELQQKIASGKKVQKTSDNPVAYFQSRELEVSISKTSQDLSDAEEGLLFLRTQDEIFSKIEDILNRAKQLIGRAQQATEPSNSFPAFQKEAEELIKEALSWANYSLKGRFLFGGEKITRVGNTYRVPYEDREIEKTDSWVSPNAVQDPASALSSQLQISEGSFKIRVFDSSGNLFLEKKITYNPSVDTLNSVSSNINASMLGSVTSAVGSDNKLSLTALTGYTFEVVEDTGGLFSSLGGDGKVEYHGNFQGMRIESENEKIEMTTDGTKIFGDPGKTPGVLFALRELVDTLNFKKSGAVEDNLRIVIQEIDDAFSRLQKERVSVGDKIQRFEAIKFRLNTKQTDFKQDLSNKEDIDSSSAFIEFTARDNILRASMLTAVRMFELTLERFI